MTDLQRMMLERIANLRGSTCHELSEELLTIPAIIGRNLGALKKAGFICHLSSERDGQKMVAITDTGRALLENGKWLKDTQ